MPRVAQLKEGKAKGLFVRLCWCCIETAGIAVATSTPKPSAALAAESGRARCRDCHARALAGLPVGRRIDA